MYNNLYNKNSKFEIQLSSIPKYKVNKSYSNVKDNIVYILNQKNEKEDIGFYYFKEWKAIRILNFYYSFENKEKLILIEKNKYSLNFNKKFYTE